MSYRINILILFIALGIHSNLYTQDTTWIRVFGDNENMIANSIIESYDHGFVIGGYTKPPTGQSGFVKDGILIKTDINGNELWRKTIGEPDDNGTGGIIVRQTNDGGYILFGCTYKFGNNNVFLMKLNACGEKEWNKIFISEHRSQWNIDMLIMEDDNYLLLLSYWGNNGTNERVWLFKVLDSGNIDWQKVYANWNPSSNNEEGRDIIKYGDNEYLISGDYYESQVGIDSNWRFVRPMFIGIDSTGDELWHTLWGLDNFHIGRSFKSAITSNNMIYSVGRNSTESIGGKKPVLYKLNSDGNQLYHKTLVNNSKIGAATTINILDDTTLLIGSSIRDFDDIQHVTIHKTDTLGNILHETELIGTDHFIASSILTYDQKLLIVGSGYLDDNWDIYLYKFNRNLVYDSIYTQAIIYDSLCPYQIVSDTISLDTTTVNLDELYSQMHEIEVFPNPTSSELNIVLGDLSDGTHINLYNSKGECVLSLPVQKNKRKYQINVDNLSSGLYIVILKNNNMIVDKKKVMIE